MASHSLSPRVVLLSWVVALAVWPLLWLLLPLLQGAAVAAAGGGFIGVAAPWGAQSWGLVNQPSVAFASSRAALVSYWLSPLLAAALLALLPLLLSSRTWAGELAIVQLGAAAAVLGLGWLPPLGVADGPAAGLERFWLVPPLAVVWGAAALGALLVLPAVLRLGASLWPGPGGPRRGRRIAAVALHLVLPALAWGGAVLLLGWPLPLAALPSAAVILAAALAGAWLFVPRAPITRRAEIEVGSLVTALLLAVAVAASAAWLGAPRGGEARALLWASERMTSNVRPAMVRTPLRPRPTPAARPARSAPGS